MRTLVRRAAAALADEPVPDDDAAEVEVPERVRADPRPSRCVADSSGDGSRITVVSGDRIGLLADAAAMLALQKASVRAARAWTQDGFGGLGLGRRRDRPRRHPAAPAARGDRRRPHRRGRAAGRVTPVKLEPTVAVRPEASPSATVLEVRSADRPGLIHIVCRALARHGLSVRSAHVSTLGPQAVDVFYVQEAVGRRLSEERAASAAHAVRQALVRTFTAGYDAAVRHVGCG